MKIKIQQFVPSGNKDIIIYNKKKDFLRVVGEGDYLEDEQGSLWTFDDSCIYMMEGGKK